MKKVIGRAAATTATELAVAIAEFIGDARLASQAEVRPTGDEIYVTINSDSIRLSLVEETLTDGSKVYNIELTEACS